MLKPYQKGDINDGEECFAQGAGDISPVEPDPWKTKLLHEHHPGLL